MDEKGSNDKNSSDSSLSESWNIVDGNDVNNVSEGSDGESIEVIEEEGSSSKEKNINKKEDKIESGEEPSSKSDDETSVTTSTLLINKSSVKENDAIPSSSIKENDAIPSSSIKENDVIPSSSIKENDDIPSTSEVEVSQNFNAINILGLVALICAVIFAGATSWMVLLRVEEIALDTFHYFVPVRSQGRSNDGKELNEVMKQIQAYEAETKNLRSLVTDLNVAVENLKNELAYSLKFAEKSGPITTSKKENIQAENEENILFREMLNIHIGNYVNASIFQNEINSSYDHVAKFVQEMIFNLTSGQELENNMEAVKLFYQIPKQLAVLHSFNSTNKNIELFVNAWRARLILVNEKMMEDMKNMQLKMVKKLIKHIKCTQKKFYTKLCNLSGMKQQECYDTFVKPYEHYEGISPSVPEEKVDPNIQLRGSEESDVIKMLKETIDNATNKQRTVELSTKKYPSDYLSEKQVENKETLRRTIENINNNEMLNKKTSKHVKEEELSIKNRKKNIDRKKFHKPEKPLKKGNLIYESALNEKGMEYNLNTDPPNNDPINSFSSFSKGQADETDSQEKRAFESGKDGLRKKKEGLPEKLTRFAETDSEGCWFLKIGSQRSKLRKNEARSNWLFERARYRSGRNT